MGNQPTPVNVGLDVSSEQARNFLEALRDEGFRAQLQERPAETLSEFGITIDPEAAIQPPDIEVIDEAFASWATPRGPSKSSCLFWGLIAYCAAGEGYEPGGD
jgi:hypothetical protein